MPLVFAAIAPHGGDTIAEIAPDPIIMAKTRAGLEELACRCAATHPETFVVLNPHGICVEGVVSLAIAPVATGELRNRSGVRGVHLVLPYDTNIAERIYNAAETARLPVLPFDTEAVVDKPYVPLDWGAFVPLWFLTGALPADAPPPKAVVLVPDRSLSRETLVQIGYAIAQAAATTETRVALIASCDQGHAHAADGPYGFDPASARHDRAMCEAIANNDLASLIDWPEEFLEAAKVDAYWQTIMLAGALTHTPMQGELLSYEAPTYFGMAVAAYEPG